MPRAPKHQSAPGSVRVIGGTLRGRKVPVLEATELRPTPDRVRATVFNWLQPFLAQARCLDLFAGTGVLGIEALSRGAAHATFVDSDPRLAKAIDICLHAFGLAELGRVHTLDVREFLVRPCAAPFDIVFLDPPYALPLQRLLAALEPWLAPSALVYVERAANMGLPEVCAVGSLIKRARAGRVSYGLIQAARGMTAGATGG
jgi:16S rRNA (guanine966-N2)-methyltransferase